MLKQKVLNFLTKQVGKKFNLNVYGKCCFSNHLYKSKFSSLNATAEYPISLYSSKIIGDVSFGEGVKVFDTVIATSTGVKIGKFTSLNKITITQFINPVVIGNFCSIAPGTRIVEANHKMDTITTYHFHNNILGDKITRDISSKGSIVIEDDVWIGSNALILSGVKIGRGAIIAAGSVVTKDVPPYSIYGGNPARFIKMRFNEDVIEKLQKSKWWEKSPDELKAVKELFAYDLNSLDDLSLLDNL